MSNQKKTFKTERGAQKFAAKLKINGQLDIQILELPDENGKRIYVVLWNEN